MMGWLWNESHCRTCKDHTRRCECNTLHFINTPSIHTSPTQHAILLTLCWHSHLTALSWCFGSIFCTVRLISFLTPPSLSLSLCWMYWFDHWCSVWLQSTHVLHLSSTNCALSPCCAGSAWAPLQSEHQQEGGGRSVCICVCDVCDKTEWENVKNSRGIAQVFDWWERERCSNSSVSGISFSFWWDA